jgi:hypothetical protein
MSVVVNGSRDSGLHAVSELLMSIIICRANLILIRMKLRRMLFNYYRETAEIVLVN